MPGLFRPDTVCKIGGQGFAKGTHRDLSEPLASASAALAPLQAGSGCVLVLHCGLCGDTEQLHSLQQSYLLPPRPPSPAPAIQNNITPSNIHEARCCSQGPLLQVAVTSVIAQCFPPQRKIVFIMCHEHRAKQSPLEWFPKGWREVVLNLNRRFWLRFFFFK